MVKPHVCLEIFLPLWGRTRPFLTWENLPWINSADVGVRWVVNDCPVCPIYRRTCITEGKASPTRGQQIGSYMFFSSPPHSHAVRIALPCANRGRVWHCTGVTRMSITALPGLESCTCVMRKIPFCMFFSYSSVHSLSCNLAADNENAMTCFARTEVLPFQGQKAPSYMSLDTALQYTVCSLAFTFQARWHKYFGSFSSSFMLLLQTVAWQYKGNCIYIEIVLTGILAKSLINLLSLKIQKKLYQWTILCWAINITDLFLTNHSQILLSLETNISVAVQKGKKGC